MTQDRQCPKQLISGYGLWPVFLVYRYKMDATFGSSDEFTCNTDLALQFCNGDVALCGRDGWAQNNDISIVNAGGHAVTIDLQGERIGEQLVDLTALDKLNDAVGCGIVGLSAESDEISRAGFQLRQQRRYMQVESKGPTGRCCDGSAGVLFDELVKLNNRVFRLG